MSDDGDGRRPRVVAAALFAAIFAVIAGDLVSDWRSGVGAVHAAAELLVLLAAAAGVFFLLADLARLRQERARLDVDLRRTREEAARWRTEARDVLRGLGAALGEQFERWNLTPAEREIALLLMKGLSLKEIAQARGTSERTVRQQARGVYRKAGVGGRAELSAFFLEDLLLPVTRPDAPA